MEITGSIDEMQFDMLADMLNTQRNNQELRGYCFEEMTVPERASYLRSMTLMTEHELHEMLQEVPGFKLWKRYDLGLVPDQMEKARQEFADVWHFLLNVALALGLTAEMIYEYYREKDAINHDRMADTKNYKKDTEE